MLNHLIKLQKGHFETLCERRPRSMRSGDDELPVNLTKMMQQHLASKL
jgi:hypothetical protein